MGGYRAIVLVALTVGGGVAAGEPPSASAYSDPPALDHLRLSPDGDRILMLRPVDGVRQLFVSDVERRASGLPILVSRDTGRHRVHERQTGRFRSQLKRIVEFGTRMAQRGGAHETAFLEKAEKLLAQELWPPERKPAAPAVLEPVAD